MPKVSIYRGDGTVVGARELNAAMFGVKSQPLLVHQVVVAEQANARQALAHTKTKGEVRGGGRKPWRQKGTGRARHGSIRSPQWRGGGVVFGPRKNRNYTLKINKKMKRQALLMVLSDKVANNRLVVLDRLEVEGKTRDWQRFSRALWPTVAPRLTAGQTPTALIMVPTIPISLRRSTKNAPGVTAIRTDSLNIMALLKHAYTMTTIEGLDHLERWLAPKKK